MATHRTTGRRLAAAALTAAGVVAGLLAGPAGAGASVAPSPGAVLAGADISWPNCPPGMGTAERPTKGEPGPNPGTQFVVLGLTNGPAFTPNPCLPAQVSAQRAAHRWTAAYSVVSFPAAAQYARYASTGPFSPTDQEGRLRNVGWAQAQFNLATLRAAGLRTPIVWVDVEPVKGHPWSTSTAENNAVIDGVVAGYHRAGFATGFYSYAYGWREITGGRRDAGPTWVPGLPSRSTALARCSQRSFSGGRVVIGQWYSSTQDFDVTCPWVTGTPAVPSPLTPYQGLRLGYGARGSAVVALQRALGVQATGWFGPLTRAAVVRVQRAHRLPATGVVDAGTWRALGAGTVHGGRPSQLTRYFAAG